MLIPTRSKIKLVFLQKLLIKVICLGLGLAYGGEEVEEMVLGGGVRWGCYGKVRGRRPSRGGCMRLKAELGRSARLQAKAMVGGGGGRGGGE